MAKAKKKSASRLFILITVVVAVLVVGGVVYKKATHTSYKAQAVQSEKSCGIASDPIINIDQKIVNDADRGANGRYWANDSYDQNIRVWQKSDKVYCAEVRLSGNFDAQPGLKSPGDKQTELTGTEDGIVEGFKIVTIQGNLKVNPEWGLTGSVGTTDYQCDLSGKCPDDESVEWYTKYFDVQEGFPKTEFYEWNYRNGDNVWIDSSDLRLGDVL